MSSKSDRPSAETAAMKLRLYADIFKKKNQNANNIDLRGITLGLENTPEFAKYYSFQDLSIFSSNLSNSKISCSFIRSHFDDVLFEGTTLDTCRYNSSKFNQCNFTSAKVLNPTLDDALFSHCIFEAATIRGRGLSGYGGRRVVFESCSFQKCVLQNIQFRACIFRDCNFTGVKSVGNHFAACKFLDCQAVESLRIDSDDQFDRVASFLK
jgi:uncharacterized protein YjbI with pentapeptide repeats